MSWFAIALVGPVLYAATNHIDKLLLERFFKEGGVGTLVIFSSLLSALALPFVYLGDPTVTAVSPVNILVLAFVGLLNVGVIWFYLLALANEEASVTTVFYQLVPVIALGLGYLVLGETLSTRQLLAMAVILAGTTLIAFEIDGENRFRLRRSTVIYMLVASAFWATESVVFKSVALQENTWRTLFWEHVMMALAGVAIYIFAPVYRNHFHTAMKANSKRILALNVTNESIYMAGNIVVAFAYLMAPISLVLLAESFQPIFVFLIGILLTIFFPRVATEKIDAKNLSQKLTAIAITGFGTFLLFS